METKKFDLEQCIWNIMSKNKTSTTFQDVRFEDKHKDLYKCKFECLGYDIICNGYKSQRDFLLLKRKYN